LNTPAENFRVYPNRAVTGFHKHMDFDCDELFKDQLRKIFAELAHDPFPDNTTKIQTDSENEASYIFEHRGRRLRIIYEIHENVREVEILYIGKRPNATGYYEMHLEELD
jgi:mRNA-degrading endonuclease RelE of RelBE toxin-antitoxin system